jgi:hypothetical protein
MNDIASHAIVFLLGTATGAAGTYFADKYTDQRRRQEGASATKKEFSRLFQMMPDLLSEMQQDVAQPKRATYREFFVIPKGAQLWPTPNSFYYEDDGSNNYLGKARILESRGYVIDVTPGNAPKFQMTEEFFTLLRTGPEKKG